MNTTLVVMAAGMGSRFGGLKQIEPLTADGRCLLDFSVYDAVKAGFNKIVFIIREDIKDDFINLIGKRMGNTVPVEYVLQDVSLLPKGRSKPFGTGHAVLACKNAVDGPFAIINADDYYGAHAYDEIHRHLASAKCGEYAMTAYELGNTTSPYGSVSRGVCEVKDGYLKSVVECKKINADFVNEVNGDTYTAHTPVSMNLWGLTPDIFDLLEEEYARFLQTADLTKDEFLINDVIFTAVRRKSASVKVFYNYDKWYGITYRDDLDEVKRAVECFIEKGMY